MNKKIVAIVLLFCLAAGSFLYAQSADTPAPMTAAARLEAGSFQGENLTIKVAVMGPGNELYYWWGHIALIIEDAITGQSFFYDYGIFSFDQDNFFFNFAMGRLWYSCGVSLTERNMAGYKYTNRDITIYTLDLPPETKIKVMNYANINVLPENRYYLYHHFYDNCSTRIRDIVDIATDGQFKAQFANTPGNFTLREQVRRHTWFSPAADWFLNFLMGQNIDTPITVWEDMFLPSEVGARIEDFWYTDENGVRRKLVTSVEKLNIAVDRPVVLIDAPKERLFYELVFGLALSAVFLFFFILAGKFRAGYLLAGFSMSLCGLFFGAMGLLLYFMSLFTSHDYTFYNVNMFAFTPLLLASVPLGICYAMTKKTDKRVEYDALLRLVWLVALIGILISMVIKLLPWFWHKNLADQLLLLPIALVFVFQPTGLREVLAKYFSGKHLKGMFLHGKVSGRKK